MNEVNDRPMSAQCDAPSDRYGWAAVLRNTLPYFLLLTAAPFLHARSAWLSWSLAPLIGLFAYRMTIVMHDCTHRTLFADPKLNVRIGKTLGAITGIDFERFSAQHWLHHRIYGQPGDPQRFHYAELKSMTRGACSGVSRSRYSHSTSGIPGPRAFSIRVISSASCALARLS
jgi:fatty acid desaturase